MIKTGLVSITFRELTPEKIVDLVSHAGLDAIEWGGDIHVPPGNPAKAEEVRDLTLSKGIKVSSYGSYYRAGESETQGMPFDSVLESALVLGAPSIRVWSGKISFSQADEAYRGRVAKDLRRIAEKAAAHNIVVSCEFHDNTLTDSAETTLALLQQAAHPNLRTYWQPRHGVPTDSGIDDLDALAPLLKDIHVFHWWPTAAERQFLADGSGRWLQFLSKIKTIPGDRHVLIEFVRDNLPGNFLRDAMVLKEWLITLAEEKSDVSAP